MDCTMVGGRPARGSGCVMGGIFGCLPFGVGVHRAIGAMVMVSAVLVGSVAASAQQASNSLVVETIDSVATDLNLYSDQNSRILLDATNDFLSSTADQSGTSSSSYPPVDDLGMSDFGIWLGEPIFTSLNKLETRSADTNVENDVYTVYVSGQSLKRTLRKLKQKVLMRPGEISVEGSLLQAWGFATDYGQATALQQLEDQLTKVYTELEVTRRPNFHPLRIWNRNLLNGVPRDWAYGRGVSQGANGARTLFGMNIKTKKGDITEYRTFRDSYFSKMVVIHVLAQDGSLHAPRFVVHGLNFFVTLGGGAPSTLDTLKAETILAWKAKNLTTTAGALDRTKVITFIKKSLLLDVESSTPAFQVSLEQPAAVPVLDKTSLLLYQFLRATLRANAANPDMVDSLKTIKDFSRFVTKFEDTNGDYELALDRGFKKFYGFDNTNDMLRKFYTFATAK